MLYERPALLHQLLEVNTGAVTAYLNAQIEAGAQAVMIFDTWGGMLSGQAFHEFSLRYMERICTQLRREREGSRIPRIVFTKGGGLWLESLAQCGADALGLDWIIDLGQARARVGDRVALQGNLDPAVLLASPEVIRREATKILAAYGHGSGHVFNLGHGISQFTPPENVAALIDAVHSESRQFH
jgi:uroporphyrinogen decarboxylase